MHTYVVRIYRRDTDEIGKVIGVIEEVETEKNHEFRNLQELIVVLTGSEEGVDELV